jgi:D-cysteine desulfhydrase family pyridoxal phosphate-dependent enzyme
MMIDLKKFPRVGIMTCPTPLEEMPTLQKAIGCKPRLFVKRDDTTTSGLGGNKNRKLDFVMAEAKKQGADVIITTAGVQSNHCRQTLALARRMGMDCHLVLTGDEPEFHQGNLLVYDILGAELHFIGESDAPGAKNPTEEMEKIAQQERARGRKPFLVPIGASTPLGALGYVESVKEISEQVKEFGVKLGHGFLATGSAGTQAGAIVGAREYYPAMKIHGVAVSREAWGQQVKVAELVTDIYKFVGMSKSATPEEVIVHDQYYGPRYGVATKEGIEAIKLVGRTEGLILDPTYTGKCMAGMIDMLKKGMLDDAEAVLFWHTGGSPITFAKAEEFQPE